MITKSKISQLQKCPCLRKDSFGGKYQAPCQGSLPDKYFGVDKSNSYFGNCNTRILNRHQFFLSLKKIPPYFSGTSSHDSINFKISKSSISILQMRAREREKEIFKAPAKLLTSCRSYNYRYWLWF